MGISAVDRACDELGLGELLAHHCSAVVMGSVIYNADPIAEIAPALVYRSQAISK